MTSAYSPRWTQPETPVTRSCDADGCPSLGEYRAPKSRDSVKNREYYWFCFDHVKAFNQSWNYFEGMSNEEMQDFLRDAMTGHRPTWERDWHRRNANEKLEDALHRGFADYLQSDYAYGGSSMPVKPVDAKTAKALALMDMAWPCTRDELKANYKKLAKQYHPDMNPSPAATEKFKRISEAYHIVLKVIVDD